MPSSPKKACLTHRFDRTLMPRVVRDTRHKMKSIGSLRGFQWPE